MTSNRDYQARVGIACPHCGGATRIRTSRAIAPTCRQTVIACINAECGATFGAQIEITHGISPSAVPDPTIQLRMAPPRRRGANDDMPAPANDGGREVPPAANDDHRLGEAVGSS